MNNDNITRLIKENWHLTTKLLVLADEINLTGLVNIRDRFFASISDTNNRPQI
ncbi:hypothetical protein [Kiloniella sp.]|uniref:hypothetical protein n=1 Tax=Kiloniella sp. TaxID=1938587 RepID=UPI003B01EFB9